MTETELIELFRRALRASVAVPLVAAAAGAAGCSSTAAPRKGDASTLDARHKPDTGHTTSTGAVDAGHDGGRPIDAGKDAGGQADTGRDVAREHDSGESDAGKDAKHHRDASDGGKQPRDVGAPDTGVDAKPDAYVNCTPAPGSPGNLTYPASCLDGGALDFGTPSSDCPASLPGGGGPNCNVVLVPPLFDGGVETVDCTYMPYCDGRAFAGMDCSAGPQRTAPSAPSSRRPRFSRPRPSTPSASCATGSARMKRRRRLAAAAEAASRDEVRHARVMGRLARKYGGRVAKRPRAGARAVRPLAEVAEENAVEGCVRETYAALAAHHKARVADDPEVREAMAGIAEDETRHAALAWGVAAWAEPRLDADGRRRVRAARAAAVRELRDALGRRVPASWTAIAGVPAAESAVRMLAVLERDLWEPAGA